MDVHPIIYFSIIICNFFIDIWDAYPLIIYWYYMLIAYLIIFWYNTQIYNSKFSTQLNCGVLVSFLNYSLMNYSTATNFSTIGNNLGQR